MILLVGIPSEPPIEVVWRAALASGDRVVLLNPRDADSIAIDWHGEEDGSLRIGDGEYRLTEFSGIYLRPLAAEQLPEFVNLPPEHSRRRHIDALYDKLFAWCEVTRAAVVNRISAMGSNTSKPFQQARIARFFDVPETVVTTAPDVVETFMRKHRRVVCKSTSGTRSIVFEVGRDDLARLPHITWCPTQFQEYIAGTDIRVHVIGRTVFATEIHTNVADYRYPDREPDGWTKLQAYAIDGDLRNKCVKLTHELGLTFAGIDLRRRDDGHLTCFEVNTSPGFSFFEAQTGQRISGAVVEVLNGKSVP